MSQEDKKKDITIYDLANELKISASTVSRALNDHFSIGAETKKAVRKLAKEKGYRTNVIASSLRTNKSSTIGIMVTWINRPFISSLIAGAEKAAKEAGYQVIITQTHDDIEMEKANLKMLYGIRVSALIVSLAMETNDYSHFDLFLDNGMPVIFADRIPKKSNVSMVNINNFNAGFDATQHLIDQGCKRIAHFGGLPHQTLYEDRCFGYKAALKKNNLYEGEELIIYANQLSADEGKRLAEQLLTLDVIPDGIFCANDTVAVSAMKYLISQGYNVPEDIAIIGFNDDPICQLINPTLSTIHHPAEKLGEYAVAQVLLALEKDYKIATTTLDTYVVQRGSTDRKIKQMKPLKSNIG